MDEAFSCTSCRHYESAISDEPCLTCSDHSNWEPVLEAFRDMMTDLDLSRAEIDSLQEDLDNVSIENVLLRDENARLRLALRNAMVLGERHD
jgi:regulator of replication initiation timing